MNREAHPPQPSGSDVPGRDPDVATEITDDIFLGGRLAILQPRHGYRAGVDAVLLAAAVNVGPQTAAAIVDCGAGVGTVGLCVATRYPAARITLVERAPELCRLASENVNRNGLQSRVSICQGDITHPAQHPGAPALPAESFDVVLANPPYHDAAGGTLARDTLKSASHAMDEGELLAWARFAARLAKPGGRVILIHKAGALSSVLAALEGRFRGFKLRPIHPTANAPAIRILIEGIKSSRAPLTILPPLVLHEEDRTFTPHVSRMLREGAGLDDVMPLEGAIKPSQP